MGFILKQIFDLLKLLNSETGTNQIAFGLAFGVVLGFSPFLSLQTFLVLFIVLFFRVQMGAVFLSAFFFKFVAYLLDTPADLLGRWMLEMDSLRDTWATLYNMPLVPLTRFNNSIVMGSGILGFVLVVPLFFVFRYSVVAYREQFLARIRNTKFYKAFAATSLYKWYLKYEQLYG